VPNSQPAFRRLVGRSLVGAFAAMVGISFAPANASPPAEPDRIVGVWWEDIGPAGGQGGSPPGVHRISP
jgi:hypothetical protein